MKRFVFGECVRGFSHIQNNTECQDSLKKLELEDGTIIMAVADGHGSKACPFSKTGSEIAVNVFCETMANLCLGYQSTPELLPIYLHREGSLKIAQTIDREWKQSVLAAHEAMEREMPVAEDGQVNCAAVYRMYGSTLLGLMITDSFTFAFQIGDGDILYANDESIEPVVQGEKLLGVESHSLSSLNAWKKAVSAVHQRNWEETLPIMFMLSTDGFSNSHVNDAEFLKTCSEYFTLLNEHGTAVLEANLNSWLAETSELGCGDDTTVLIAYFTDEANEPLGEAGEVISYDAFQEADAGSAAEADPMCDSGDSAGQPVEDAADLEV